MKIASWQQLTRGKSTGGPNFDAPWAIFSEGNEQLIKGQDWRGAQIRDEQGVAINLFGVREEVHDAVATFIVEAVVVFLIEPRSEPSLERSEVTWCAGTKPDG